MRVLRDSSEDEMVACFLAGELTSTRFGAGILAVLDEHGWEPELITAADPTDAATNRQRRTVLAATRGHGQDRDVFEHLVPDVPWVWADLDRDELGRVRYIEYSYWNALSGGSRLPIDAARRIDQGITVFDVPDTRFLEAADALRHGATFPPLIVAGPADHDLVCLEGHLRLTAYALAGLPEHLVCLVGVTPRLARWVG